MTDGKVFGWLGYHRGKQMRMICLSKSYAAVVRIAKDANLDWPRRDYVGLTSNPVELEVTAERPGVIFWRRHGDWDGEYTEASRG